MKKVKSIHFVGIKGVGLTPLAIIAKEAGIKVTGSDLEEEFITDKALAKAGITPFVGFSPENVPDDVDVVITTGAHGGFENPEVIEATTRLIPVLTKGEAVGQFMEGEIIGRKFKGIAIAGSHGKTTTTALLATILRENKLDPSYSVGTGSMGEGLLPGHLGKGEYFVVESDEYATEPKKNHKAQFLWQYPEIALITNIEHDHPDIYPTLEEVVRVFEEFSRHVSKDGLLVGNGDDPRVSAIAQQAHCKTITYGLSPRNDYVITRVHISGSQTFFRVETKGMDLGEFHLSVAGEHNALNALGASIVAFETGLSLENVKKALPLFSGSKRRLEYRGRLVTGASVYDDYAHHPTEIKTTLRTLRQAYPKGTIIAVFQPHTYSRTKALFNEFITAFDDANAVILTDIFASARESVDPSVSSQLLVQRLASRHPAVLYVPSFEEIATFLVGKKLRENTIIVFMGAGDIYKTVDLLPLE